MPTVAVNRCGSCRAGPEAAWYAFDSRHRQAFLTESGRFYTGICIGHKSQLLLRQDKAELQRGTRKHVRLPRCQDSLL